MFHKNAANSIRNNFSDGPRLVSSTTNVEKCTASAMPELVAIASRRCSSFFAEAAVLVLVFGILDFFLQRGHMDLGWVAGALGISVALLAASVATDFGARRWLGAHP
ncbi:hypothetical protein Terro_4054 [Terriglobus roseus DSM 18391]|uniref:Uncharacterized protein n=1 Tax=Terriglobus roseus (strain DSM 18391 / NRRL B-41598 / KBS 63) TaxID=926566 RepID=I3ZLZ3_TERRK|nr:hypothetical protein [Terriglobus roseus]AFL90261.1 hypothetical protein Terro_4054 [Terriglobus roseus DSM 18391]